MLDHRIINRLFVLGFVLLSAASCTTATQSNPPRTATEQLLISTAADRAANQLSLPVNKGTMVFVDATNFEGTDSKYAIGAIREALLRRGAFLIDDKKMATTVVEIRSGALSTDQDEFLIGIPQFNVPIPFAGSPVALPEIALYKSADQKGVAKFAMFAYDAKTGAMVAPQDPQYGFSHNVKKTAMIFFSWSENDTIPDDGENPISKGWHEIVPPKPPQQPSVQVMPQPPTAQPIVQPAPKS